MQLPLDPQDRDKAQFNIIAELLANVKAINSVVVSLYATQNGLTFEEAMAKFQKVVDDNREDINNGLDEDYGSIDFESIVNK